MGRGKSGVGGWPGPEGTGWASIIYRRRQKHWFRAYNKGAKSEGTVKRETDVYERYRNQNKRKLVPCRAGRIRRRSATTEGERFCPKPREWIGKKTPEISEKNSLKLRGGKERKEKILQIKGQLKRR